MKKLLFILFSSILVISYASTNNINKPKWYQNDPRIEVVNETTVIFKKCRQNRN